MKLHIQPNKEKRLFNEGLTPFLMACEFNNLKTLKNTLKQSHANPFSRDRDGFGMFEYALLDENDKRRTEKLHYLIDLVLDNLHLYHSYNPHFYALGDIKLEDE